MKKFSRETLSFSSSIAILFTSLVLDISGEAAIALYVTTLGVFFLIYGLNIPRNTFDRELPKYRFRLAVEVTIFFFAVGAWVGLGARGIYLQCRDMPNVLDCATPLELATIFVPFLMLIPRVLLPTQDQTLAYYGITKGDPYWKDKIERDRHVSAGVIMLIFAMGLGLGDYLDVILLFMAFLFLLRNIVRKRQTLSSFNDMASVIDLQKRNFWLSMGTRSTNLFGTFAFLSFAFFVNLPSVDFHDINQVLVIVMMGFSLLMLTFSIYYKWSHRKTSVLVILPIIFLFGIMIFGGDFRILPFVDVFNTGRLGNQVFLGAFNFLLLFLATSLIFTKPEKPKDNIRRNFREILANYRNKVKTSALEFLKFSWFIVVLVAYFILYVNGMYTLEIPQLRVFLTMIAVLLVVILFTQPKRLGIFYEEK